MSLSSSPTDPPSRPLRDANSSVQSEGEKELRAEIGRRNTVLFGLVDDEGSVAIADGAAETTTERTETPRSEPEKEPKQEPEPKDLTALEKKMKRVVKPRAYSLFLLEKAAMIAEDALFGLTNNAEAESSPGTEKERVAVLGTGWGSAAFLKEIDTDAFDVTVISPRNFFLFTPMLAGASVGTVDVRSITEPIRQVS